ncbi:MAG: MFS transporter [Actinomycetota bacterium]
MRVQGKPRVLGRSRGAIACAGVPATPRAASATSSPRPSFVIATIALATVCSVFPGLASGSLAVQASEDFGISEGAWGWTLSAFFLGSASSSVILGRLAQRIGPRRQLLMTTLGSGLVQLLIATTARSFTAVLVLLAIAGCINAAAQTAVNLALSQANLPRLGVAVATKQSAMPAASMLGGLAVPALALTLGWRWAYGMGFVVAMIAFVGVWWLVAPGVIPATPTERAIESSDRLLLFVAFVSFLLAYTSGSINAWLVASGVDAGLSEGAAGFALSAAAAFGISLRLFAGTRFDRSTVPPLAAAARVFVFGIIGFLLLMVRSPGLHVAAGFLAFGGGWIWPAFTNFAIVNANPRSAARATGMTQTGVYLGVMAAPATTGSLVDRVGYPAMWLVTACVGVGAVAGLLVAAPHFRRPTPLGDETSSGSDDAGRQGS